MQLRNLGKYLLKMNFLLDQSRRTFQKNWVSNHTRLASGSRMLVT
uniref:Uncharacterized protein n=1 Tax=Rhizophora mucronata TaxID=61149 RepID=A0A2P2PBG6_RHIMU